LVVATAPVALAAVDPTSGSCRENLTGPTCQYQYGQVTGINDGDGMDVDIAGDGTATPVSIRINGLQAMELYPDGYSDTPADRRGQCHGVEAANRLQGLVPVGSRVRLAAQALSSNSGGRPRRSVFVQDGGGTWRDAARTMLSEGHALWLPAPDVEWSHNVEYSTLAIAARASGVNLWDTDACGTGPSQSNPLKLWVNWDANGADGGSNLNGEWIRVKNRGTTDINLAGWSLRDAAYRGNSTGASTLGRGFVFPTGAKLLAGKTVTLFMGSGTSTATSFYWRQTAAVFENVTLATGTGPGRGLGDGAYLFDPNGDLRTSMIYPCRTSCTDFLIGKVFISAMYDPAGADTAANEYVYLKNTSSARIQLESYQVWNWPFGYVFGAGSYLDPGEALRLYLGKGTSTRTKRYWGLDQAYLSNSGDNVALRTLTNIVIACKTWGSNTTCRTTD